MENDVEKEVEQISYVRHKKNAGKHRDVAQNSGAEELAFVKHVACQIGYKRPNDKKHKALKRVSSMRVVLVFKSMPHVDNQKQTKDKM